MSNFGENFGFDAYTDTEEHARSFFGYIINTGKSIPNYYGYPYIFKSLGKAEYFVRVKPTEEQRYEVSGFDSHCAGNCIWNMLHSGIDLSSEESPKLSRVLLLSKEDGTSLVPIELITADVYPSFLKGDRYKIQVIGLPISISYYSDEEAYNDALPKDDEGQTWGVANGSLFPAAFMYNHFPEHYEKGFDPESDKIVSFMATVKKLSWGYVNITGEGYRAFLRCFIDTQFGELELEHTLDQVDPEQLDNIKVGAIVSGECVLSGDLAIDEYENGIIKDHEHDLRLLRYTFVRGEEERLRTILAENAVYSSESTGKQFVGRENIVDQICKIRKARQDSKTELTTRMATITEAPEGVEYPVGTRCFVLSYDEEDEYEAIAFIELDDSGMIEKVKISTDSRYHFKVDDENSPDCSSEDMNIPESVEEAMYLKANAVLAIWPWDEDLESFHNGIKNRDTYVKTATRMLERAKYFFHTGPLERVEILFSNLFARAFAERLLSEIGVSLPEPSVEKMFEAEMVCPLNTEWTERFQKALDYGKQCFKDYKDYCVLIGMQASADKLFVDGASLGMYLYIGRRALYAG